MDVYVCVCVKYLVKLKSTRSAAIAAMWRRWDANLVHNVHKIYWNYLNHNINERPFTCFSTIFVGFFRASSRSFSATKFNLYFILLLLVLLFLSSLSSFLAFFFSHSQWLCVCVCECAHFFLQHLFLPQHFPSSGLEWALVVWIVCFLIFLSIIKSLLLLNISLPFQFLSSALRTIRCHPMACHGMSSTVLSMFTGPFAYSVAFWFYFGSFHIASVNNLKSPIYNNQWR